MMMTLKSSMAPVGASDARLLLLGSLPGDASLAAQRYYAHPTNQFWRLLGAVLDEPLETLSYDDKLGRLAVRGVVLWDIIQQAQRVGSLDAAIRKVTTNDLESFVAHHRRLRAIGLNGLTAQVTARGVFGAGCAFELVDLPSSSAANTRRFEWKAERWRALAPFAEPA